MLPRTNKIAELLRKSDKAEARRMKMQWKMIHPTKPGLYWISLDPKKREPAPWQVIETVFQLLITPAGDVFDLSNGKNEPLYTVSTLPNIPGVKYASASTRKPEDPWLNAND